MAHLKSDDFLEVEEFRRRINSGFMAQDSDDVKLLEPEESV